MKRNILSFAIVLLAVFGIQSSFAAAEAHKNPPPKVTMIEMMQKLQKGGYHEINSIEYDGKEKAYEVKGLDDKGIKVEAKLSDDLAKLPKGLPFSKTEPKALPQVTMMEAMKKVMDAGYHDACKLEVAKNANYEVAALDKDGKKVDLKVDSKTGKVSKAGLINELLQKFE